jgi:hypothetical protein
LLNINAYAAGPKSFKLDLPSAPSSSHLHAISSVVIPLPELSKAQEGKFDEALRELLWHAWPDAEEGMQVLRAKGLYQTADGQSRGQSLKLKETFKLIVWTVVQGVREIYETKPVHTVASDPSKLVLIGRHLPADLADQFLRRLTSST